MSEELDLFRVRAEYDVEVEKKSLNNASKLLDAFYKKYNDKSLKVDTADMATAVKQGVSEMQQIYKKGMDQMAAYQADLSTQPPWWQAEAGLEDSLNREMSMMRDFFNDAKVLFSDKSLVSGLDDILTKSMENVSIVAVDLGERVNYLRTQITDTVDSLKQIGAVEISEYGVIGYAGDSMSEEELKQRISLLEKVLEWQREIESFNNKKFSYDNSPTSMESSSLNSNISEMKQNLFALKAFNLETTEQLRRRNQIIKNATSVFDFVDQDDAIKNIEYDDLYNSNIDQLKCFIQKRKDAIQELKNNEDELFSIDGISDYIKTANKQIESFQSQINELNTFKYGESDDTNDMPVVGNLSEVIDALGRVEQAVRDVVDAFKPLTDALSNSDSAIGAMVSATVGDLEILNAKVEEAFKNIETLSNKQFNVTNVISNGDNKSNDLEQIRAFRREAKEVYKQVEELYIESTKTAQKIKGTPEGISSFLDFSNTMADFDMADLAKRIKSRSAASLGIVIDELNEWKKVLLQFNNLRNNVDAGSFNVSKYNDTSSKVSIGTKTNDKDEKTIAEDTKVDDNDILNQVKDLSAQVQEELVSIRAKIEETFNFATLNPQLDNVQTIADNIYNIFADLQEKVNALQFTLQLPEVIDKNKAESDLIDGASDAMDNEGDAAQDAVPKKNAFTEANKKAADSAKATEDATKSAAEGIEAESKAIEQSAGAIVEANDKFDKVKYVTNADGDNISKQTTSTTKRQNAYETEIQNFIYDEDGNEELQTTTIIKDFKKRAAEVEKVAAKVALAKKTVDKFLSQFDNKTAGHGSDIAGYDSLKNFSNNMKDLDDIENAMQQMMALDTKYNDLTKNFRKGTKSMNPFVNAFNSMDEMRNKVREIQLDFENLSYPTSDLKKQVEDLPGLLEALSTALTPDEKGVINIEKIAEAYGNLNASIKQINSSIKLGVKEEKPIRAQEEEMWAAYNAAAKKERQIEESYRQYEKEEKLAREKEKVDDDKASNDFFDTANEKELNAIYKERSEIITRIIQLSKKLATLKTDKAKERTKRELNREQDRLASLNIDIDEYGDLVNQEKIKKQNKRLTDNNIDVEIGQTETNQNNINNAYDKSLKLLEKIYDIKKKLVGVDEESSKGQELNRKLTALQEEYNLTSDILDKEQHRALFKERVKFQKELTTKEKEFGEQQDEQSEKERNKQEVSDLEFLISLYKDYADAKLKLHKMQKDTSGTTHDEAIATEIDRANKAKQVLADLGIDVDKISESELLTEKQINALLEERINLQNKLRDIDDAAADKAATRENKEAQKYGKTIYNREKRNYDTIAGYKKSFENVDFDDKFLDQIKEYETAYKKLEDLRNRFANDPTAEKDAGLKAQFNESAIEVENLRKALINAFKEYQKFSNISADDLLGETTLDVNKFNDAKSAMLNFANEVTNGKIKFEGFNAAGTEMYGVIDRGSGILEKVTVKFHDLTGEMKAFTSGTKQVTTSWSKLGSELRQGISQIAGQYIGFHELWQAVKQGVEYVKEIDLAMTELKKVTDETDEAYNKFLSNASKTAAVIGSTVSDFTDATAAFARLGYTIDESSKMAETAIIYKNVADGLDSVEESTDSIISTMMAYGIEANDTMSIIDKFNAVGNNFAITSAGIGEAMQRSASALKAGGNTIDESIALITTANSVIQNPEQVGTALKTLTLRLRGAKVELEEAGLETEAMAESTSQLQAKLKALTHGKVDIMLDADTFKSTTQILREMSEAWEDMTDIERAGALELMGGKRQANILASVITNFETVEKVIETSVNSQGSALEENERWLDSIEGKTYQFTNALETMWSNMLNSEVIKGFIDFGTTMIKFLDTVPGKVTAVVAALTGIAKWKGISVLGLGKEAQANLQSYQQALFKLNSLKASGVEYDSTSIMAYANAIDGLTAKKQAEMLATIGLNKAQIIEVMQRNKVDDAVIGETLSKMSLKNTNEKLTTTTVQAALASQGLTNATKDKAVADFLAANGSKTLTAELLSQAVQQKILTAEQAAAILTTNKLAFSWKALGSSIAMAFKMNPIGFIVSIATTIMTVVIPAIDKFHTSAAELKEEVKDLAETYESVKDTFESNLTTLTTSSDTKQFKTLQDEFNMLAQGVDKYGNNISLTSDQYERYKTICQQIVGIQPSIAAGYDSASQAIGNNVNVLEDLIELQKIQARLNAEERVSDENFGKFSDDAWNDYEEALRNASAKKTTTTSDLNAILYQSFKSAKQIAADELGSFDFSGNGTEDDDLMEYVLSTLGIEDTLPIINEYLEAGQYDVNRFLNDYYDQIKESSLDFGVEYQDVLHNTFTDIGNAIRSGGDKIKAANDGLVDDFLVVPQSLESYEGISAEGKNFITDWIKNSSQFKVDANQTKDIALENRDKIIDMVNFMAGEDFTAELEGKTISGKDLLDQIYNFDLSSVNWQDYKTKAESFVKAMWNAIGGAENSFGMTQSDLINAFGFNFTEMESGWQIAAEQIVSHTDMAFEDVQKMLGDEMNAKQVDAFFKINWNNVDWDNIKTKKDILAIVNKRAQEFNDVQSVNTYSVIASSIESYNKVLSQTSEIISDNTEVTKEYKDSLIDLGLSEEDLAECFDENNGLIVKNVDKLKDLIKKQKDEYKNNVKTAKSQAKLKYYKLAKDLVNTVKSTKNLTNTQRDHIKAILEEMDAVQDTISKYNMLEAELLGVTNAYKKLADAQEIDSATDYGSKAEEMVNALASAFNTGELGTAAAEAAFEGLIPDWVVANAQSVDEAMESAYNYMKSGALSNLFDIKYDDDGKLESVQMTLDKVKAFTSALTEADTVFHGTWDEFTLDPAINNLDDFANAIGVTKEVAFAYLTELERYDASNIFGDSATGLLDQLMGDDFDYAMQQASQKYAKAAADMAEEFNKVNPMVDMFNRKILYDDEGYMVTMASESFKASDFGLDEDFAFNVTPILPDGTKLENVEDYIYDHLASGGKLEDMDIFLGSYATMDEAIAKGERLSELQGIYYENQLAIEELENKALDFASAWGKTSDQLTDAREEAESLGRELADAKNGVNESTGRTVEEIEADIKKNDQMISDLLSNLDKLKDEFGGEPTEMVVGVALDEVEEDIDNFKKDLEKKPAELQAAITEIDSTGFENLGLTKNADGTWSGLAELDWYQKLDPASQAEVTNYLNMIESEHYLNLLMGDGVPTIEDHLQTISTVLQDIARMMDPTYTLHADTYTATSNIIEFKSWWNSLGDKVVTLYQRTIGSWFGGNNVNGTANVSGTAYAGGKWGAKQTEASLVGELGPEMVVRGNRWFTVGENGAEFTQVKKGDIIFNHKQTEELLKNGHVTGRGKAYASGTAYAGINTFTPYVPPVVSSGGNSNSDDRDNDDDIADDSEQVVDFIEMKLEEIEAIIEKTSTRIANFLDDTTSIKSKDELYDELVKAEKDKSEAYLKAAQKYNVEAAAALSGVPRQYQEMARNGAIAIKEFIGEDQVEIAEAIEKYREFAAKADEAENGHLESIAAISAHRVEQLEDIATDFENIISISKSHSDLLQAEMDLIEESGNRLSEDYYEELKKHSQKQLDDMQNERAALQKILDDSVAAGDVIIGSDDWYSMLETIYEVDQEIIDCKTSLEEFQNAINELYWDNFDKLIEQLDTVDSELSNLYDLVSDADDVVDKAGNWTADGYTALGLLIQQMEVAQQKSKEYGDAISKLKKDYKDGLYSTDEYNKKLAELTDGQYDAIKSYEDAKDAIIDLNKTRVDVVKDGIQKEIDAYEELINKKKESLDADKDARDFERSVEESNKSIFEVERKIASLKGNTSRSAIAERRRLEEELRKLQQEREDLFYDESVKNQQEALDKELESFQDAKNKEIEDLEKYLENQEKVLQDSFAIVQENTQQIAGKLVEIAEDYGVTISDTVAAPWINGANAIGTYEEQLNTSVSATTKNLETLKQQLKDLETQADKTANSVINATHSTVIETNDGHQTSIKGYAKGSKSVEYDQWALIDELGDELQLVPNKAGRLDYIKKGTGILNNTITEKLIDLAVDPTSMLENSRPVVGTPGITTTNNNISIDMHIAEVVHINHADNSSISDVTKAIKTQMDNYMRDINNKLRRK